ncbi:MAG: agmatinase [Bacteroidota bacterium]
MKQMIQLIGIPFDANSSFLKGAAYAPARIRLADQEGAANNYSESGLAVVKGEIYHDNGDLKFETTQAANAYQIINESIAKLVKTGDKVLSLGGDHSISFPIISAFAAHYESLNVLHLDAHADLYDNFDDNPYSHASPFARIMEKGLVRSLTQVGIRTFNTHQRTQVERYQIRVVEMKDFSYDFLQSLEAPLYISLDLDVLDPAFAPGVSHHEPGGMSTRQLLETIQRIPVEIVGADIVEYNPVRDVHDMTAMLAYKLMKELMAKMV